jgi:hypothetical protein
MSDSEVSVIGLCLKWLGRIMAICAAGFVIMSHEGVGPPSFDAIGKALFWTSIVFVPLFTLNQDVLRSSTGKLLAVSLFAVQLIFVNWFFGKLKELNFIVLTPLCFGQCLIFMLIFMLVRKRNSGIWY